MDFLGSIGASLALCVALEELRITVLYPKHLATIMDEILPTLPQTTSLSRIVLDADGGLPQDGGVDRQMWRSLDAVMAGYAERISAKHPNRRLTLQFRTDEEGATGENDGWVGGLVGSLALFTKVGDVEYVSKH